MHSHGLQGYAELFNNEYYESRWDDQIDQRDPKFKNVQRYSIFINLLSNDELFRSYNKNYCNYRFTGRL